MSIQAPFCTKIHVGFLGGRVVCTGVPHVVVRFPTAVPRLSLECLPKNFSGMPAESCRVCLECPHPKNQAENPARTESPTTNLTRVTTPKNLAETSAGYPWSLRKSCRESRKQPWSAHERSVHAEYPPAENPDSLGGPQGFSRSVGRHST